MVEFVLFGEIGVERALALCRLGQKLGQTVVGLGANDKVDHGLAGGDLGAFGLGDAAGNANF